MQQPPPYEQNAGPSAQYTSQPCPTKPGAPMQAGYAANPAYPPSVPATTTTTTRTIVQQQPPAVILNPGILFHEVPVNMNCPTCKVQIVTATEYQPGSLAWLACFGLAAIGCALGCCFIPFCIDDMKDVTHSCPNCKAVLGIYHRM